MSFRYEGRDQQPHYAACDRHVGDIEHAGVNRPRGEIHEISHAAVLRDAINQTGIGPQGLGGATTALAVHIESAWTHITCNPVAVNLQCWRAERRRAKVWANGQVQVGF